MLAVAAAGVFVGNKVTSGGGGPKKGPTTLLFSIAGADRSALESALLAHDTATTTSPGVELLLPRRTLTQVCGFGDQQLGGILRLPNGETLSRDAVSSLLGGVTVNGSWVLTTVQLSKLVDALHGVDANVDTNVVQPRPDGTRVVLVPAGQQHLNGAQAAAYATYVQGNEDATGNLVRLQSVLDGILSKLPPDEKAVQQLVSSLGPGAGSTLGGEKLAQLLVHLRADVRANTILPVDLPTQKIDAGGAPAYRVDPAQTTQFVKTNLASSWPLSARKPRKSVFIENGVGTPGLAGPACSKLVAAGYSFAGSGNAATFNFTTSKVLVFDSSIASAELGDSVAGALGLPTSDVAVDSTGQNIADVIVILGKDFKP